MYQSSNRRGDSPVSIIGAGIAGAWQALLFAQAGHAVTLYERSDAAGLRDPDTNLAWGIKYLAGAYRAANSDHSRAVHYYASGYYYAAKRQRTERIRHPADANALQTSR